MPDQLEIFKPLVLTEDVQKGETKRFSSFKTANGTGLTWYMVERDSETWSTDSDDMKNLFKSFGISREDEEDWYVALGRCNEDFYNAKRMIIVALDMDDDESYIDGSSLRLNVPIGTGSTDYVTFYSSSYNGYTYKHPGYPDRTYFSSIEYDEAGYGGAYAYMFPNSHGSNSLTGVSGSIPDGWHMPYSGSVNGLSNPNNADSFTDPSTFFNKRSVPHVGAFNLNECDELGYDAPYGIALLERGLVVLFDMEGRNDFIANCANLYNGTGVGSFVWTGNQTTFRATISGSGNYVYNSDPDNRKGVSFTGTNADAIALASYRTINKSYKLIYFCHADQHEFNSTTNHTYNHARAYLRPEEADSIYITEIALYGNIYDIDQRGISNQPFAYVKLSEPIEKNKLETITFKVELEL